MVNKVTLIGNLGKDPEVRRLENGVTVARFSIATTENYKDQSGNWQDRTEWHNVTAWRFLAEKAESSFKKGMLVYVEGKLSTRKYTDSNNIERWATDVVASYARVINNRSEGGGGGLIKDSFPKEEPVGMTGNYGGGSNNNSSTASSSESAPAPVADADGGEDGDLPF